MENKNLENNDKVLLTFAGNSDPIRGGYDGPILHICRYYKPKKIYLILTKEMQVRNEDRIYERTVKESLENYNPEFEYINTDIKDAHIFDVYFDIINSTFERIKKEHFNMEILVNLTSGTSQMTSNLITYIIDSTDIRITPLQVSTPENKGNTTKVVDNQYQVENERENNFDNMEEFRTKRILIPDLKRYSRVLVKKQIQELLKQYEYVSIKELLKRDIFDRKVELATLLNYANERKHLVGLSSNDKLRNINYENSKLYYYTKNKNKYKIPNWYQIVDYFALANIEAKSGNIGRYILMLEPLIVNIYLSILEDVLKIDMNSLFDEKKGNYFINCSKLSLEQKNHIKKNKFLKGELRNGNISGVFLIAIIDYYLKTRNSKVIDVNFFKELSEIYKKVKETRNDLAHTLFQVNKEEFEKGTRMKIEKINDKIIEFFKKYYSEFGYKESMVYIYDEINKVINEILEKES